jgi:hypothetical protein
MINCLVLFLRIGSYAIPKFFWSTSPMRAQRNANNFRFTLLYYVQRQSATRCVDRPASNQSTFFREELCLEEAAAAAAAEMGGTWGAAGACFTEASASASAAAAAAAAAVSFPVFLST